MAAGRSLAATATNAEHWLLLEVRGAWPRDVSAEGALSEAAQEAVAAWLEQMPRSRLLFVRRPGRSGARQLAFVIHAAESTATVRRIELSTTLAIWPASTSQPTVSSRIRSSFSSAAMGRAMPVALVAAQLSTVRLRLGAATKRCGSRPITAGIDSRQMCSCCQMGSTSAAWTPRARRSSSLERSRVVSTSSTTAAERVMRQMCRPPSEWYERLATWSPSRIYTSSESTVPWCDFGLGTGRNTRRWSKRSSVQSVPASCGAQPNLKALSARIL